MASYLPLADISTTRNLVMLIESGGYRDMVILVDWVGI